VIVQDQGFRNGGPDTMGSYGIGSRMNNRLYDARIEDAMQISAVPLKSFN
jgi:hypothetical protein